MAPMLDFPVSSWTPTFMYQQREKTYSQPNSMPPKLYPTLVETSRKRH